MTRAEAKKRSKEIIKEHTGSLVLGAFLYLLLPAIVIGLLQFMTNITVVNGGSTAPITLLKLIVELIIIYTSISFIKLCAKTINESREVGIVESAISMKGFGKYLLIKIILGIILIICVVVIMVIAMLSLIGSAASSSGDYYSLISVAANFLVGIFIFLIVAIVVGFIIEVFLMSIPYLIVAREDLGPWDVFAKSVSIGAKNFGALLLLNLSYIGWLFLVGITLGIALLWVAPYMILTNYQIIGELSDNYFRGYDNYEENEPKNNEMNYGMGYGENYGVHNSENNKMDYGAHSHENNDDIVIFDAEVYDDELKVSKEDDTQEIHKENDIQEVDKEIPVQKEEKHSINESEENK